MTRRGGRRGAGAGRVLGVVAGVLAGAAGINAGPHLHAGATGRSMLTPLGGADSSRAQNLAWGAINVAAATGFLALAGRADPDRPAWARAVPVLAGVAAMTSFGATYTAVAARRAPVTRA